MKKLIRIILLILILFLSITASFAQTLGDYQSVGDGDWTTLSTWQRFNGTSWVTPTAGQGYPSQNTGTGTVTIQNGNTVTIPNTLTTQTFTQLIVTGASSTDRSTLNLSTNKTITLNTTKITLTNFGQIYWQDNANLYLPSGVSFIVTNSGGVYPEEGNASELIFIGGNKYASSNGNGGNEFSFQQINNAGGSILAVPSAPSTNCGLTIQLTGGVTGTYQSGPSYSWAGSGTGTITWNQPTNTQSPSVSVSTTGSYTFTLTVTDQTTPFFTNSQSISVVVSSVPSAPTAVISTLSTICAGSSSNLNATSAGNTINWYTVSTGGTNIGTSASGVNFSVTPASTTTYYAEALTGSGCVSSTRTSATVTVNAIPTVTSTVPGARCGTGPVTVVATPSTGTIDWYAAATGGSPLLSGNTSYTPTISSTTTYYAQANSSGCISATRSPVIATVDIAPTISLSSASGTDAQTKCINTAITNITYSIGGGATGASVSAILPAGVTGNYSAGVFKISGTPSVVGNFNYIITISGSGACPAVPTAAGNIYVNSINPGSILKGATNPDGCAPLDPNPAGSAVVATGPGIITYTTWEQSTDNQVTWQNAAGNTTTSYLTFNPAPMNVTTSLRRVAASTLNGISCFDYSNVLTYTVWPKPTLGLIQPTGAIPEVCVNATITLTNSTSGGVWSSSANGIATVSGGIVTGVSTGTVTITYTFTDGNGCSDSATRSVKVNPLPTLFTVTGGGNFCPGGSGVNVGLDGSELGVNYQLQLDGSNTGSSVSGTGSAISFGLQTATGTYTVVATNPTTSCTKSMTGNTIVTSKDVTAPTFTKPADFSFCVSDILTPVFNPTPNPIDPEYDDLTTPRPDYYRFNLGDPDFDLDKIANNYSDNCCAVDDLVLHWKIDFSPIPDPDPNHIPLHALITKTAITDQTVKPSAYGTIYFSADGINFTNVTHWITYWLVDCYGKKSAEKTVAITINPRPKMTKVP